MPTLDWMGKSKVVNHHRDVPYRILQRDETKSLLNSEGSDCGNMIIHGDNLEALKALLPEFEGRVDCIYIDPPYNTGNEGWVYNDNVNDPRIKRWLGEVVGKEGEDFTRHDKWLCMMYPRLQLLRRLLSENGSIFISIDDNEYANLKLICDEIFGAACFQSAVIWQKRYTRSNNTVAFTNTTEYILVYSKSPSWMVNLLPRTEETDSAYTNPDNDPRGPWMTASFVNPAKREDRPALCYPIKAPDGRVVEHPTHAWKQTREKCLQYQAEGRFWWGINGDAVYPRLKMYLSEARGLTPVNFWSHQYAGNTDIGGNQLKEVMGEKVFEYPKPTLLIQRVLEHATRADSIILDSFAGSGTTAQAVMQKNLEDGGHRRFILVEMGDYADSITAERARRVIKGYSEGDKAVAGIDCGFSYYELGPVLFDADGSLNESVSREDVMRYVWHTECAGPFEPHFAEHPYYMGTEHRTAYYLAYEPNADTILTSAMLATFPVKGNTTVVYADRCLLTDSQLENLGVVFKQIPRQIARI